MAGDIEFVRNTVPCLAQTHSLRPAFSNIARFGTILDSFVFRVGIGISFLFLAFLLFLRVHWLDTFRAIAIDCNSLYAEVPGRQIGLLDLFNAAFIRHIDCLADSSGDKRLHGSHHSYMCQVMNRSLALGRFECTVENSEVFLIDIVGGFDRVILLDGVDDLFDLIDIVA